MKFKVGDKVRVINKDKGGSRPIGYEGTITSMYCPAIYGGMPVCCLDGGNGSWESELELINKGKNMNIKSVWNQIKRSEPEKTFNKLGITDENDELTAEGLSLYQNWRFQQDKAQFKTEVADPILAEQEKDSK